MIYLDSSTRSLQVVIATNVSTTQCDVISSFYDVPKRQKQDFSEYNGALSVTTTNNSTHITAVSAPGQAVTRNLKSLSLYNADVSSFLTFSVKLDDAGAKKVIHKQTLSTGQVLHYEDGAGWSVGGP